MKRALLPLLFTALLTGCVDSASYPTINSTPEDTDVVPVSQSDLLHRNYLLINYDGKTITPKNMSPRISFNETFHISGAMCNSFAGQGTLKNNILKVSNMVSTQTLCMDDVRNELDLVINDMLTKGAAIALVDKTLTLSTVEHTLIFTHRDYVF